MIKLGILGSSFGNGHPYSWSAIFNGYDPQYMSQCPFPIIPQYLNKHQLPQECIHGANVTHIWTQNKETSKHIAQATFIPNIVENYVDMVKKVDAILLARDDANNHFSIAQPFIEYGLPIYIDKPIALTLKALNKIFNIRRNKNQIFTCSAFSFLDNWKTFNQSIKASHASIPSFWSTYAIHIIEPIIKLVYKQSPQNIIKNIKTLKLRQETIVNVLWSDNLMTQFTTTESLNFPLEFVLLTENNTNIVHVDEDAFVYFKSALQMFVDIINNKKNVFDDKIINNCVRIIEAGL